MNKPRMTEEQIKHQAKFAEKIEILSVEVLKDLEEGKMEVDIEPLMSSIEEYAKFPDFDDEQVTKWQERVSKITELLEAQYEKVQEELQNLVENNPKLAAYDKADQVDKEE